VEKNQYDLCIEILRRLDKVGVLENLILIGSWCLPFYKEYFKSTTYGFTLRTRDMDFLVIPNKKFKAKVDLPELFQDLGFVVGFKGQEGYITLDHPDLAIEFLVPEKGRGSDKPFKLPALGINAQQLRYIQLLSQDVIKIEKEGISVNLPNPVLFAFHKLIVASLRSKKDKAEKDRDAAIQTLREVLDKKGVNFISKYFKTIIPSWQKKIIKLLEDSGEKELLSIVKA